MAESVHNVDCDLVLEMEEAGVGVEEILQYARGTLSDTEVRLLVYGLREILSPLRRQATGQENSCGDSPSSDSDAAIRDEAFSVLK